MTPFQALANLSGVTLAVVAVWGLLFGGAYLCRVAGGWSTGSSAAMVTGSYIGLAALDFAWFGFDTNGYLGALGMLVPCAAAIGTVTIWPRRPRVD